MYGTLNIKKKTDKNRSYNWGQNILYGTNIFLTANNFHLKVAISGGLIADKCHEFILYLVQRTGNFYGGFKQVYKFFHKNVAPFFIIVKRRQVAFSLSRHVPFSYPVLRLWIALAVSRRSIFAP